LPVIQRYGRGFFSFSPWYIISAILSLAATIFRPTAAGAVLLVLISTAAFVLVVVGLRLAAGILLFVVFNRLAATGGFGVLTTHNLFPPFVCRSEKAAQQVWKGDNGYV